MTIIVGITGGIASGKSFISKYLKELKIPTHESDKIVGNLYKNPKKDFLIFLKKNGFNNAVTGKQVVKKIISNEIFSNKHKKENLENFIHNKVKKNRDLFIKKNKKEEIVFLDIPLLFENKLEKICDFVCCAISPLKKRKARAINRVGMNKKLLRQILKSQTKDTIRKKKSDFIINTSGSKLNTYLQVDNIINSVIKRKSKKK